MNFSQLWSESFPYAKKKKNPQSINIVKVRGKETWQKSNLMSNCTQHTQKKILQTRLQVQEDTSQRSHWQLVCSSSCDQWPCQVCLRVQPRLLTKRMCCDPNIGTLSALPSSLLQSLHLEDAGEEWKFSMLLFKFFSPSFFSYLNPPKYSFEIITTKSTCHPYQHKWKCCPQLHSTPRWIPYWHL